MRFIKTTQRGSKSPKNIYDKLLTAACIFSFACAIELEEMVVVTGGALGAAVGGAISGRVAVYNENGHKEQFPDLRTPRSSHGCAHFVNSQKRVVSIVCYVQFGPFLLQF